MKNEKGQTLLLGVTILMVLLIGISVIVFVNQTRTFHQQSSTEGNISQGVAEEALSFAIVELSSTTTIWQDALGGMFPEDCNNANPLTSASGSSFKLTCSTGSVGNTTLESYQLAVTAVALASARTSEPERPIRAVRAILSRRTLGADLTTNQHAAAALQLVKQPQITSVSADALSVHWGPVVCLDASQDAANNPSIWTLPAPMDLDRYPRKFSVGGLYGASFSRAGSSPGAGPASDQKEYWAYAPIAPPPLIDESTYSQMAKSETTISQLPVSKITSLPIAAMNCTVGNCGYFRPTPGDTAIFGSGYALSGGAIIYVDGSAEFDSISVNQATFIITGALSVNDHSGGDFRSLRVPPTAPLEYPYNPSGQPCQSSSVCPSPVKIQFRGFLYVKGNMYVNTDGWTMAGALMVGDVQAPTGTSGTLVIPGTSGSTNAGMTLYYDDVINHAILVNPISSAGQIKVEPDSIQDVPAF